MPAPLIKHREIPMPTISMFYGIIVRMYALDNKQHHLPHIHVEYAGMDCFA
jgi:hypothetical protein